MPTPSEDWIQESLARLEAAEQERQEQERALESVNDAASMKRISAKIDALDAEIRSLYAQLESAAAGEDGAGDEEDQTSTGQFQPQAAVPAAAPAPAALDDYDPFGASPQAAVTREEPATSYGADASYETSSGVGADLDDEPRGGAMKWVVMGLLAIGGLGAGGFVMTQQKAAPPPTAADTGPAQVISASAVPPDTQGPTVAQGGDADRIEGTKIRETKRGGGGGGGGSRPAPRQKGDGHSIAIEKSNDPLAGLK
jgi:hypothetical protein